MLGACRTGPHTTTIASTWQVAGSTISVAAWSSDSVGLQRAIGRMRDSTASVDTATLRAALRRAWDAERDNLRQRPEWRDVADGYILDLTIPLLRGAADSALLDLGGLFVWFGPPTQRMVGLANPDNALDLVAQVELRSGALSTVSGWAEQRSLTVLAGDAFTAAAWASALFSLGCDQVLARAPRLEARQVSVVCADSAGVRWSPGLQNRVALLPGRVP